jgi:hypothetical protein
MSSDFFIIDSIREKLDLKDGLNHRVGKRETGGQNSQLNF